MIWNFQKIFPLTACTLKLKLSLLDPPPSLLTQREGEKNWAPVTDNPDYGEGVFLHFFRAVRPPPLPREKEEKESSYDIELKWQRKQVTHVSKHCSWSLLIDEIILTMTGHIDIVSWYLTATEDPRGMWIIWITKSRSQHPALLKSDMQTF